jgi:hypothetical protein
MRLYSAAEVLATLRPTDLLIKIDLTSGFYQLRIRPEHYKFYGIYYNHTPYAFTRLPMGHPLTPGVLQRFAQAVAAILHEKFGVSVLSYLDDWLIFAEQVPSNDIQDEIRNLGITINYSKSILQPTPSLVYLGLLIDVRQSLQPTTSCIARTYA